MKLLGFFCFVFLFLINIFGSFGVCSVYWSGVEIDEIVGGFYLFILFFFLSS